MIDSGCFGHVCPPWFAPQFPMVSSINVEAVAANNVALQHYGQKVVYGHVMTNSGQRILIQITFDVMNVRKPLLSTSALKHRGVTIIFNHDYDRIIFRNETVNLVSHDCHSYLHVILTNGIPPRKALVMAGESATNDVDEEVYDNDGAERHDNVGQTSGDKIKKCIRDKKTQTGQKNIWDKIKNDKRDKKNMGPKVRGGGEGGRVGSQTWKTWGLKGMGLGEGLEGGGPEGGGPKGAGSKGLGSKGGAPKGGASKGGGPEGGGPEGEGRRVGGPKFRAFFPSPALIFILFLSLSGSLFVEFWWC